MQSHELGEWFLRCRGYAEADVEELSSRVAAAICVPRPAFIPAHHQYGEDLTALCTQCDHAENREISKLKEGDSCPQCGGSVTINLEK